MPTPWRWRAALVAITLFALWLRLDGLMWDDRSHPHPDERFNTMVASNLHAGKLTPPGRTDADRDALRSACKARNAGPEGVGGWFDTPCSDLNPANAGHPGYPYGQLPLTAVRLAAESAVAAGGAPVLVEYGGIALVGRVVSAACDVLALLATFLLGRLLWGRAVGVLAAGFYAVAVLPIQSSHFWTVDTSATLFATLALLFLVRLARHGQRADAVAFGAAYGLGLACKISVAPLLALLPLAALWAPDRVAYTPRPGLPERFALRLPDVALALAAAFATFRIASPYAFAGPGWSDVWPAQAFLDQIAESRRLASGAVDFPPNWQWLGRVPWIDPARDLILWGLGPALGLAAVAGLASCGIRLLRATQIARVRAIAWLWAVGYFAWMGQQWVSSMRYLLPIYPVLCVFAAAWLVPRLRHWRIARARGARRGAPWAPVAIALVALVTTGWALAFHHVHVTLHPYVAATHWILRHVEAPVSARVAAGPSSPLVNWAAAGPFGDGVTPSGIASTQAPATGAIDRLRLHRVALVHAASVPSIELRVVDRHGQVLASTGEVALPFAADAAPGAEVGGVELPLAAPLQLTGGEAYGLRVAVRGGAVELSGARIVQEGGWNDPVPMSVVRLPASDGFDVAGPSGTAAWSAEGVDPFGQRYYASLNLDMAADDDDAKRRRLIGHLDAGEWLVVPNNRFYDSVTRNPLRFPLATRFYDALFTGELGYSPALVVASQPQLAGIVVPDQAIPEFGRPVRGRPGLAWASEEAFSVYDHPAVHVFRKDAGYTRAAVERALGTLELTDVGTALRADKPAVAGRLGWSTAEASAAPDGLLRGPRAAEPRGPAAGADRAPPSGIAQLAAAVAWYALALALGALAWPWLAALWPDLADRGYGAARIAGIVAVALPAWWLATFRVPAWSFGGLALLLGAFAAATAVFAWGRRRRGARVSRAVLRVALVGECAFLALFLLGIGLRLANPDLWAPSLGGEKPMDFAMFNRVLAADHFPPGDAWFAEGRLNYYYFGWVLVGVLTKLTGTPAALAYNLALPLWLALTGVAAGALAFDAVAAARARGARMAPAWVAAGVALAATVLLGNLDLPRAVAPTVGAVRAVVAGDAPVTAAALGDALTRHSERWFWAPSRTVGERPGASHEINEFPAFSFLFGDLHAHVLAMPLQLLALCALLGLAASALAAPTPAAPGGARERWRRFLPGVAAAAVPVGLLRATNTWDWPVYLAAAGAAVAVIAWRQVATDLRRHGGARAARARVVGVGGAVALLVAAQWLVGWPFRHFVTGAVELRVFGGMRTPLSAWLAMHGWFLLVLGGWSLALARRRPAPPPGGAGARNALAALRFVRWGGIVATGLIEVAVLHRGSGNLPALGVQLALVAWLIEVAWRHAERPDERAGLLLALAGFALAVVVELVVIGRDLGRMNTFFKLHLQAWLLLAIASGIAAGGLARGGLAPPARRLWRPALAAATLLAAAYLPLATYGRAQVRFDPGAPATLDGEAFLAYAVHEENGTRLRLADDARIIRWLRANAGPDDTVLEAQLPEYRWGSRMSTYSGRPTLLGYRFHQTQQRPIPALDEAIELRRHNVAAIYSSADADRTLAALRHYRVRYVIVGGLERAAYPPAGRATLAALAASGELEVALAAGDDVVYRVRDAGGPALAGQPAW